MRTSLTLLANAGPVIDLTGPAIHAAGWTGHTPGLHAVSLRLSGFIGRIIVEAALVVTPAEADWFPVPLGGLDALDLPQAGGQPVTATLGYTFRLNALWLRARLVRSHLVGPGTPEDRLAGMGRVEWLRVNY